MERDVEEQLKTTLMYDDKEKLRRKLEILQREYVRTAEKLKRAERLEAVRHHVKNRIIQQNHQGQSDKDVTSKLQISQSPLKLNPGSAAADNGSWDNDNTRGRHVIRILLPSDSSCQQSPDPCHDGEGGQRFSPALRLRSRRSRLRLERRSTEASVNPDNHEEAEEKGKEMESFKIEKEVEEIQRATVEVKYEEEEGTVNETEDLFSGSTSLTHSHWETHPYTANIGDKEEEEKTPLESSALPVKFGNLTEDTEQTSRVCTLKRKRKQEEERNDVEMNKCHGPPVSSAENRNNNAEQNATVKKENKSYNENNVVVKKRQSVGLLDSCTLVEGLIFPAEYYVRTTRRMTMSQSQPDMQAVILSQLNMGRHRRSRGRGRGANTRRWQSDVCSGQTASSPLTTSSGHEPSNNSLVDGAAEVTVDHQSSSHITERNQSSPGTCTPAARRGGRRKGIRARRRRQTPVSGRDEQPTPPLSSSPCPPDPVTDAGQTVLHLSTPTQHAPAVTGDQSGPASGQQQNVYPMFVRRSNREKSQMSQSPSSCQSLLLPSSPPAQTPVLPLPSLTSISVLKTLVSLETHQDFHLPDDQFASLKLQKLQQVVTEAGVEHFSSPFCKTRSSVSRGLPPCSSNDTDLSLSLTLSLTPTVAKSQNRAPMDGKSLNKQSKRSLSEEPLSSRDQCENVKSQPGSVAVSVIQPSAATEQTTDTNPETQPSERSAESPRGEVNDQVTGQSTDFGVEQSALERDHRPSNEERESGAVIKHLSFDWPLQETPVIGCSAARSCDVSEAAGVMSLVQDLKTDEKCLPCHDVTSQPSALTAPSPFTTPHLTSPAPPSVGLTPHPVSPGLPPTPSPSAPVLNLAPSPPSPTAFTPSPPSLSPCPSFTCFPSRDSPVVPIEAPLEPKPSDTQCLSAEPQEKSSTETLKTPAGGRLVDACCLSGPSGRLYVAAAGKWAACLWSRTETSGWTLIHTWTFRHPVINVFPVPDAAGLMFVTLGQLEIREVRTLSCTSFMQMLLCEGVVQAAVGVYKSRVVTSSHSSAGSTLQVFDQSNHSRKPNAHSLVSPGVRVGALAPVEGLSDALIGSDETARVFIWHLETGQLLRTLVLPDALMPSVCLRGFSYRGVLFVLLQHQQLVTVEEEREKRAFFSVVAVNPLNRTSMVLTQLYPPTVWSGRLCEADVNSSSVVGLSQNGCVCVWELQRHRASRMVWAPEKEGWQLARWGGGGGDTLLTAHHSGDVTLHYFSQI